MRTMLTFMVLTMIATGSAKAQTPIPSAPTPQTQAVASSAPAAAVSDLPLPRSDPEAAGMSADRLQRIDTVLNDDVASGRMPGAVVAIARHGRLVYFKAFGYRDKAANASMTTDAIFNIASMTKPMTTVGLLILQEQGRLLLSDPVDKYLPLLARRSVATLNDARTSITATVPAARPITIRDLLTHTSGLIYGGRGGTAVHALYPPGSVAAAVAMSGPDFLQKLANAPLLYQPGTVWDYGFGLDVAGLVIEAVTHQSLGAWLHDQVFAPLGMADTGFVVPPERVDRYAHALPTDPQSGQTQTMDRDATKPAQFECGGGCAVSTAADYLRFASMLLQAGTFDGARILSRPTVAYMTSNQLAPNVRNLIGNADPTRADYGFGLGVAVRTTAGVVPLLGSVGDFSWPGASGTNWWVDPREQLVVVFMAHTPGPARWHYRTLINALVYQAIVN